MGFHKRGDEESSVQEDSCGKTVLAYRTVSVCQLEIEIERELERKMTSCTEPEYTCSLFVTCTSCSTHEHCQSELPWRKDCVEEIQEMTGAKLMSVSQGSCSLPSIRRERNVELNEKPTLMVTNCPAIAFTLRVSAKARLLNKRFAEHLEE